MGILEGKNILVTGVLTEGSIAFDVARLCQQEGATVVLTGMGRTLKVTQAMGRRLPTEALAVELDVTNPEQLSPSNSPRSLDLSRSTCLTSTEWCTRLALRRSP